MDAKLIVMLTHHDQTVSNALDVFNAAKGLPVDYWGFKDVGLPRNQMLELVQAIKAAGKTAFLEVVSYTEEACMDGARLAVACGFDCLMGTLFYPSVWEYLKDKPIRYYPFVGEVSGSPSILEGTPEAMIGQVRRFAELGVHGTDLLAYRYTGDAEGLAARYCTESPLPCCVAGSIDSVARLVAVDAINPETFTMGGALFDGKFVAGKDFCANLQRVIDIMESIYTNSRKAG